MRNIQVFSALPICYFRRCIKSIAEQSCQANAKYNKL